MAKNFVQPGRVLTFLESELVKPSTRIASGDPVLCGRIAGVAQTTTTATTDSVAVAVEGVFNVTCSTVHNGISKGETVYIDPSTAAVSDDNADVPFGVALGTIANGGSAASIPVRLFGATPGASGANS